MTVYDPTDLVPLRVETRNELLELVTTGSVTFTVTSPAGVEGSPLTGVETATGLWDVDVNVAASPHLGQPGVYVWRSVATGAVTGEQGGWFVVQGRRAPGPVWTPSLDKVADLVPARTLSSILTPGEEEYLGTFTSTTTPTDEQAERHIIAAIAYVRSTAGAVIDSTLYDDATHAAAVTAAAFIELSYPTRDADLSTYDRLWALAGTLTASLADANSAVTGGASTLEQSLLPQWSYPSPVPWGDSLIP